MDGATRIRLELEVSATKMIQQYMLHNEHLEKEIEVGIKKAFENFDFETEIQKSVEGAIRASIKDYRLWSDIRAKIKDKVNEIVDKKFDTIADDIAKEIAKK